MVAGAAFYVVFWRLNCVYSFRADTSNGQTMNNFEEFGVSGTFIDIYPSGAEKLLKIIRQMRMKLIELIILFASLFFRSVIERLF